MINNHIYRFIIVFLVIVLQFSCTKNYEKVKEQKISRDSVSFWIDKSKDTSFTIDERRHFLLLSYRKLKRVPFDTVNVRNLSTIAYENLKLHDTVLFLKQNNEALNLAKKIKDSFAIGDVYWNYASLYNNKQVYDSAYYYFRLANLYFDKSNHLYEAAKTEYGMAFVNGRFKNYYGSETLIFRAIKKFEVLQDNESLYDCYNRLALTQLDIFEYDRALFYHEKALEYVKKIKNNKKYYQSSWNNIGLTYLYKGEYRIALDYFNRILEDENLRTQNPLKYATVIDNRAYCKLLMKDTLNTLKDLKEGLYIRDSLHSRGGIVMSKVRLSNYYIFINDTVNAINSSREAKALAKEINNGGDYLESLSILAEIDEVNAKEYLEEYIKFSDSSHLAERLIQDKFTRISYETDEYIDKVERLSQQKVLMLVIGSALILILYSIYRIRNQRLKNEKLLLENEQQKSNEQIYIITLQQHQKLEEEKAKERIRISQKLHDGILGKLFGVRVALGFIDVDSSEVEDQYQQYLEELQNIEKEIREVSHELSDDLDSSDANFINIINMLVKDKKDISNLNIKTEFESSIDWQKVDIKVKVNLYRIIQEALQNIIKHAQAKNVNIKFQYDNKHLILSIEDDGVGFKAKHHKKGIGIKNIESRVKSLKGVFDIQSELNKGTIIKITIPKN